MNRITLAVVTYNNPDMVETMLRTLFSHTGFEGRVIVVNNDGIRLGSHPSQSDNDRVLWISTRENLGWERGVNLALGQCETEFFCMANDDLVFPPDMGFWQKLLRHMDDPTVGGVAPSSNYVAGTQNLFAPFGAYAVESPYLIGMLAFYRTADLEALKGLDTSLPGGDDIDLSIRVKGLGRRLIAERRAYVHHHGSVTGRREHGADWDSHAHQMRTVNALVRKHGFVKWYETWCGVPKILNEHYTPESIAKKVDALCAHVVKSGVDIFEGSSTLPQLLFLADQVRGMKRVCEVGFNAGMSACAMLAANPDLVLESFDVGEWECLKPAKGWIDREFPKRHILHLGDSKDTLPLLTGSNTVYDLAFIDGGHDFSEVVSDMRHLAPVSRKVLVDDIQMPEVEKAFEFALAHKWLTPIRTYADKTAHIPRSWVLCRGGAK